MNPEKGKVVVVATIPSCYFCELEGRDVPGPYDFATRMGPWANGCERHWRAYRARPALGVGAGQLWITKDQVTA
jgi:hypothetical protein